MNRTDRLYAIVEELRAVAPRPRSSAWLAARFEVSTRTIERDVLALQEGGTPIWAQTGRGGGYCLDPAATLPPLNFTADEAVAVAIALRTADPSPYSASGGSAMAKLLAAMRGAEGASAHEVAERIFLLGPEPSSAGQETDYRAVARAVAGHRVLHVRYRDQRGGTTERDVEPLGFIGSTAGWYLVGWCRLRNAIRNFKLDRIEAYAPTGESAAPRRLRLADIQVPMGDLRSFTLV